MTMPHEVPNQITPLTVDGLLNALVLSWETLNRPVTRAAVELKTAHIVLETGLNACHCWNVGNRKHVDGDDYNWCCFGCGEEVQLTLQGELPPALRSPYVTRKGAPYRRGVQLWQSVWIVPPHPWARFCAHESLAEGIRGQLRYLQRHPKVLDALCTGDPVIYNDALIAAGYYTASPAKYLQGMTNCLDQIERESFNWIGWGDVP